MDKIAIVTGGESTEREISLKSAKNVQNVLTGRYEVTVFDFPDDCEAFFAARHDFAVVIPVMHGKGGEDGALQGFLETLRIPYIFSRILAHAVALDKDKTKALVAASGIATPASIVLHRGERCRYVHPSVVKPRDGGSTVATAIVRSQEELAVALEAAFVVSHDIIIEDFIDGEEFTVAVIDDERGSRALPVILIRPQQGLFDYKSKYDVHALADEVCPAPIAPELTASLQDIALKAHQILGCRQVSRTDIIVDEHGVPWFLETNTIPGMTETSLLPKACDVDGRGFASYLAYWIEETKNRPV